MNVFRSTPLKFSFLLLRGVGLIVFVFLCAAAANPLHRSLEDWELLIADDPRAAHKLIEASWHTLDPSVAPGVYLRVFSMDCMVRAQIGKELRSEALIEEALQLALKMQAWDEVVFLTTCKARVRMKAGLHDEARQLLEESLAVAKRYSRNGLQIRTLVTLSDTYLYDNDLSKSLDLLHQAQTILKSDQRLTQIDQERLKVEIAMALETAGAHDVGVEIYESAIKFFQEKELRRYQVVAHYNLAVHYYSNQKVRSLKKARAHYQSAADLSLALDDEHTYAIALTGVANVERELKNYALADSLMEKTIRIFENKDRVWWSDSLIVQSAIKKEMGKPQQALELLEKAEAILPEGEDAARQTIKVEKELVLLQMERFREAYQLRKELSENLIAKLKSDAAKEYSKLKVDLGLVVEEERGALLKQENDRQKKISYYKSIATLFLSILLITLVISMVWLKVQHDKIKSMQKHIQENVLQRFLPPQIIESILSGRSPLDEAAQEATVTILFCDLVDFTSSSERLGADRIARVLNHFFKEMSEEIFDSGGTIDKFIGDAIMVLFGAPIHEDAATQAQKAFECAKRILKRMDKLNEVWLKEEGAEFAIRIGIHQGQAIVGSFGSQKRSDYTAIGLHVNIAARIETAARPNSIFFSAAIAKHLPPGQYLSMGAFRLRGISEELELFANNSEVEISRQVS